MKTADLHIHTTFSDGKLTPRQIVVEAHRRGLAAVGITDHDTMRGIPEAIKAGEELGVEVTPGVELSTDFAGRELHILGYYCHPEQSLLKKTLAIIRIDRYNRVINMLARLNAGGVDLLLEDVLAVAPGGESLGRPHLAEALCRKGYCVTSKEAFQRFLGKGRSAFVQRLKISSATAINLIRLSGGVAVLAHPALYGDDLTIPLLKRRGLSGIEVFHPSHRLSDCRRYFRLAQRYNLLITGGSDFHGPVAGAASAPGALAIDYRCLERLKKAARNTAGTDVEIIRKKDFSRR